MDESIGPCEPDQIGFADQLALTFEQHLKQIERTRADADGNLTPQQQLPPGKKSILVKEVRAFADRAQAGLPTLPIPSLWHRARSGHVADWRGSGSVVRFCK